MLQDAISILILVIMPLLGIVSFRRIAKTKRQRPARSHLPPEITGYALGVVCKIDL